MACQTHAYTRLDENSCHVKTFTIQLSQCVYFFRKPRLKANKNRDVEVLFPSMGKECISLNKSENANLGSKNRKNFPCALLSFFLLSENPKTISRMKEKEHSPHLIHTRTVLRT